MALLSRAGDHEQESSASWGSGSARCLAESIANVPITSSRGPCQHTLQADGRAHRGTAMAGCGESLAVPCIDDTADARHQNTTKDMFARLGLIGEVVAFGSGRRPVSETILGCERGAGELLADWRLLAQLSHGTAARPRDPLSADACALAADDKALRVRPRRAAAGAVGNANTELNVFTLQRSASSGDVQACAKRGGHGRKSLAAIRRNACPVASFEQS